MDDRSKSRVVVDLEVEVHVNGRPLCARLYDLSMDGCMIEFAEDTHDAPFPIELALPRLHGTRGTVLWKQGRFCGVKFKTPMQEVVVAHLGFKPTPDASDVFRDQFGRPLGKPEGRYELKPSSSPPA